MNASDEIKRLHELHLAGALTDVEFQQAKARLLSAASVNMANELNKPLAASSGSSIGNDILQLRRTRTERWLGGVCGGLAKYTGTEAWIWRIMFALFVLTFGFSAVMYVLLWIFVPEE